MTPEEKRAMRRQAIENHIHLLERRYPSAVRAEAVRVLKERLKMLENEEVAA